MSVLTEDEAKIYLGVTETESRDDGPSEWKGPTMDRCICPPPKDGHIFRSPSCLVPGHGCHYMHVPQVAHLTTHARKPAYSAHKSKS